MKLKKIAKLAAAVIALEGTARWAYQKQWGIPFEPKVIGEYPYSELLEEVPAPWHYRLKKDFSHPLININSHRLRSPFYCKSGKKLLVIGESNLFGTKLLNEEENWPWQLDRLLNRNGHRDWQILNASFPGYCVDQYKTWWDQELKALKPDKVVLSIGLNDFTQAHSMGSTWKPGAPWPLDFVLALKRAKPWSQKYLGHSAAYYYYRQKRSGQATSFFVPHDDVFQIEQCRDHVVKTVVQIAREARELGADVAFLGGFTAYDMNPALAKWPALGVLQGNWEFVVEHDLEVIVPYLTECETVMPANDISFLPVQKYFLAQPDRTRLYRDLVHLNERGMSVLTRALYEEIKNLGWW